MPPAVGAAFAWVARGALPAGPLPPLPRGSSPRPACSPHGPADTRSPLPAAPAVTQPDRPGPPSFRPPRGPLRLRVLCCPKLSPAEPPSRRAPEPHLRSASSLGARAIRLPVPSAPPRVGRPGSAPFTFPPPRHPINSTRLGLSVAPRLHCGPQRGGQGRPGITSEPTAFPRLLVECLFVTNVLPASFFLKTGEKRTQPFTNLQKNAQNGQSVGFLHGFFKVLVFGVPVNQVKLQQGTKPQQ